MEEFYLSYSGFLGISYLYWAILAFLMAMISFFIKIPPFALPRDPSNWIFKKLVLFYFPGTAWLIISWICYRLYRRKGDASFGIYLLFGLAITLFLAFLIVWGTDRFKIKKMKYQNVSEQK